MTPTKRAPSLWWRFFTWAVVVVALDVLAIGIYFLWDAVPGLLILKLAATVVVALGLSAAGINWLRGVVRSPRGAVRWPLYLKRATVVAALGLSAAGIYFLWGVAPWPLFVKWAVTVAALGVSAIGIYLLWGAVRRQGKELFLKWAGVVAALGVCAAGILLLWGVWDGTPVAAAFTRVGGATYVETALEASRFWLTPPEYVVTTQTGSSQLMLGAAQCAIVHDAPLLYTWPNRKRQRLVDAKINDWRKIETPTGLARPEASIQSYHDLWRSMVTTLPKLITIKSQPDVTACVGKKHRPDIARLSTLKVPDPLFQLRRVQRVQSLAPVVVFAAAFQPGNPPDVAVGLALAAHMARANREKVSLVVVPHYLESDAELEKKLQSQHELVTGGVVLGQIPTVPDDTRTLLRQLLTSRDQQGVLAQVQANLGSAGTLITALLLALAGAATATQIVRVIVRNEREPAKGKPAKGKPAKGKPAKGKPAKGKPAKGKPAKGKPAKGKPAKGKPAKGKPAKGKLISPQGEKPVPQEQSDWLIALDGKREVTVWLRSDRKVTGTMERQFPGDARVATVFRIKEAPSKDGPQPRPEGKYVLVSVKDIEQIEIKEEPTSLRGRFTSIMRKIRRGAQKPVTEETTSVTQEQSEWLIALDGKREVTVWLRSGRKVTGTMERQFPGDARVATVFRIKEAPSKDGPQPRPEGKYVLVSVKDIELIEISDSESEAAKNQPAAG